MFSCLSVSFQSFSTTSLPVCGTAVFATSLHLKITTLYRMQCGEDSSISLMSKPTVHMHFFLYLPQVNTRSLCTLALAF